MAIIYTYPEKSQAEGNDLILISDSADNNKTKQVKVSSLPSSGGGGDTYSLQADAKNGNDIPLVLNAALGSDSTVNITQGQNVTLTRNSASQITIDSTNTQYSVANSTTLGLVKIFSDTVQGVAANAVQATPGKTYGIQLNSDNQAVVNVPWQDNNTEYTAGNGLELTSTTFAADLLADGGIVFSGGNNELGLDLGGTAIAGNLSVARGGTGANTLTGVLVGNGTSAISGSGDINDLVSAQFSTISQGSMYFGNVPPGLSGTPLANTCIGNKVGNLLTTGATNTLVGEAAGGSLTTGSTNVIIGARADVASGNVLDATVVGNAATGSRDGVAIGKDANAGRDGIAIGSGAECNANEIAIASASHAITLDATSRTATTFLPIKINGAEYFIQLYTA